MKKMIAALMCLFLMTGCTNDKPSANVQPSATPEATTGADLCEEYTELQAENVFKTTDHEGVEKMLAHGTGVLVFSFPECPWCQAYLPMLNEAAQNAGLDEISYYNIHVDKEEDREWYDKIAKELEEKDSKISRYNKDGDLLIYMPLVVFLDGGEIVNYDDESCDISTKDISVEDYWTKEKVDSLYSRLEDYMKPIVEARQTLSDGGCAVKDITEKCGE